MGLDAGVAEGGFVFSQSKRVDGAVFSEVGKAWGRWRVFREPVRLPKVETPKRELKDSTRSSRGQVGTGAQVRVFSGQGACRDTDALRASWQ